MKPLLKAMTAIACLTYPSSLYSQTSGFDLLAEYQLFLDEHTNMTTSDLLEMNPVGLFKDVTGVPWQSVAYHELVDAACELTLDERFLLQRNGFVVTERLRQDSVIDQMLFAWENDLPLFISADAILHAVGLVIVNKRSARYLVVKLHCPISHSLVTFLFLACYLSLPIPFQCFGHSRCVHNQSRI